MTWIVDIVALVIVIICAAIAYFKGFVKTFFGFISAILALVLAFMLYKPLAAYLRDTTDIDDWVYESIVSLNGNKSDKNVGETEDSNEDIEEDNNSESSLEILDKSGLSDGFLGMVDSLPSTISNSLNESLNINERKDKLVSDIATKVAETVVNVLAWVIIYIAIRIILLILMLIFDGVMQLPFLKEVNNVAGLILGALMGVFRVYLILAIIYFISNVTNISGIVDAIQSSFVVSHLYNNNLLINLIF